MAMDLNSLESTDRNYNKVGKTRLDAVVSENLVHSQGDAYFRKEIVSLHMLAEKSWSTLSWREWEESDIMGHPINLVDYS